uniref:Transmembrane protein n=1 Tax=Brassica oleracea TaxID=3712 RepID=A0A3P6H0Q2_BRAOL|nr:unnamed protein product [Brassica oleracea]
MSADWGPVIVAVALFILLSPGLLFQLPARTRVMEFDSMKGYLHLTGNSPNKSSKSAGGDVEIDSEDQDRRSPGESITNNTTPTRTGAQSAISDEKDMHDWAAPLIASALFASLSPGLILQFPGKESPVDFMNMKTTVASIFVHTILYGLFLILFLVVLNVHVYA